MRMLKRLIRPKGKVYTDVEEEKKSNAARSIPILCLNFLSGRRKARNLYTTINGTGCHDFYIAVIALIYILANRLSRFKNYY